MSTTSSVPKHPGPFIRERIIPPGISVTDAANRLGIGRPALSRMLNGNSSLSQQMAVRLEKTFGADSQMLLDMQSAFERHGNMGQEKSIAVRTYVPSFLSIKARQIDEWPNGNLEARQLLPVLLRRLVHSTGQQLSEVDFPGFDNAERKGLDGKTVSGEATAWIPQGSACWEFGVNQQPGSKAEGDYQKRTKSVPPSERQDSTFVFVTPRNWPGKAAWVQKKMNIGDWKSVRAYDASDLEQWLEESIPVQIWFADVLGLPTRGIRTLDQCWESWSKASNPEFTPAIFDSMVATHGDTLKKWLVSKPGKPLTIAADSKEEALAFLACVFCRNSIDLEYGDLVAVFESVDALRNLVSTPAPFIPIVSNEETERALAGMHRERHCIVVRPRNAVHPSPEISLGLDQEKFIEALVTMGFDREEAGSLARASGRSLTVLRRRLSPIDAIRTPNWASDAETARRLVPIAMIGEWHARYKADREILSLLAGQPYEEVEQDIASLLEMEDGPIWSSGEYRGVVSRIDSLFAVSRQVTEKDLDDFLVLAELVLSESDPALELPEEQRWAADVYGKTREHSGMLRKSICETLALLSVHGDDLFHKRLGMFVEVRVCELIERLLKPLSPAKLLSQNSDLPRYAEAAPEIFLSLIEEDLKQNEPAVFELLKPVGDNVFGQPLRTHLAWALECLAWKHMARVAPILARLSKIEIEDNWVNRPINSLFAIYRSWMPQTAASLQERIISLKALARKFPEIGWKVCMEQLVEGTQTGMDSYRPHWRSDASGAGKVAETYAEINEFRSKVLEIVLDWPSHDGKTLQDLVQRIRLLSDDAQEKVWELIDNWANSEPDNLAKAKLADSIRRFTLIRRSKKRSLDCAITNRAREACEKLRSSDLAIRHAWLFANSWIELSAEDMEDEDLENAHLRHKRRIEQLRVDAMRELWDTRGFEGVMALLNSGAVPYLAGSYLARIVSSARERANILRNCLSGGDDLERQMDGFMWGFLGRLKKGKRYRAVSDVISFRDLDQTVRVFRCMPFAEDTWHRLGDLGKEVSTNYWRKVGPSPAKYSEKELVEIIDRLLEAKRPLAAFSTVQYCWSLIDTSRLKRLLLEVATVRDESSETYHSDPYHISKALDALNERTDITEEEMAQLEFLFISFIDQREYRISNIERQIAKNPIFFVQLLAQMIKRSDGGEDPAHWKVENSEIEWRGSTAFQIFREMKFIPGTMPNGEIDEKVLLDWITETRKLCSEYGRAEMGDHYIGQLLSRVDVDESGVWPDRAVCEVMEVVASIEIGRGFALGVRNSRGAHWRDKGGEQERVLAAQYRRWADELKFEFPHVGGVLEDIAVDYERESVWQDDQAEIWCRLQR